MLSIVTASPAGGFALICSAAARAASSDSKMTIPLPVPSPRMTQFPATKPGACLRAGMPFSFRNSLPSVDVVNRGLGDYCVHWCLPLVAYVRPTLQAAKTDLQDELTTGRKFTYGVSSRRTAEALVPLSRVA